MPPHSDEQPSRKSEVEWPRSQTRDAAAKRLRTCRVITAAASLQGELAIDVPFHVGHLVHAIDVGTGLVLAEDVPARGADRAAAVGPVAPHAGHDHAQAVAAEGLRDAFHHHVDRGLVAADRRPVANHGLHRRAHAADLQVLSAWGNQDVVGFEQVPLAASRMDNSLSESSRQASGLVKLGGMCCTTTIGGMGGRSDSNKQARAGGPPVEMPIAMHLSASSSGKRTGRFARTGH